VKLEWSDAALADLDRFEEFLRREHPDLALIAIKAISNAAGALEAFPKLGRPIAGRKEYRQMVRRALNARYIFQYRFDGVRLVMLGSFMAVSGEVESLNNDEKRQAIDHRLGQPQQ
jgi:plasmid stabilization system protein ParE